MKIDIGYIIIAVSCGLITVSLAVKFFVYILIEVDMPKLCSKI